MSPRKTTKESSSQNILCYLQTETDFSIWIPTEIFGIFGCFPLCQRFRKFRLEFKWKSPFRFLPTGIFGTTSGGGPLISVEIFRPKSVVPFLTNRFFALIREFGRETNSDMSHSYWLARFNRKMSSIFSDRSVWHNGEHPRTPCVWLTSPQYSGACLMASGDEKNYIFNSKHCNRKTRFYIGT